MNDRLTRGFLAGVVGAIPMNMLNLFNYYITKFAKLRYLDYAGFVVFNRLPKTIWEVIFSQLGQLVFAGAVGVIFAFFIQETSSRNYIFKGWLFGVVTWFGVHAITVIAKIKPLTTLDLSSAVWQFISVSIWGIVLTLTLAWLSNKKTIF